MEMHEEESPEQPAENLGHAPEGPCGPVSDARPGRARRRDAFAQIPWSFTFCGVTLGLLAAFRGVFSLLDYVHGPGTSFVTVMPLWLTMFALMGILPLWMLWRGGTLRWPRVGRVAKEFALAVPLLTGLLIVVAVIIRVLMPLFKIGVESGAPLARLREAPNDPRLYWLLVPMFTLGPLAEELFFRGFLYNALRRWMTPLLAVAIQGLVFALAHYGSPFAQGAGSLAVVFFVGIVLVGVYEWRKTLWASIALHSLYNSLFAGPVIMLMMLNSHTPAKTWLEAEQPPGWMSTPGWLPVERQANGEAQRLHAINTWGTKGMHLWKQEIREMEALCAWFPNDRPACAQARDGIAMIFRVYLRDPRRAIVQCNEVLSEFPDQPESCAGVLLTKAEAHQDIGDQQQCREAYSEIIRRYGVLEWARTAAEQGLQELDRQ
jgi:membrane protease YdiL (CAAX protease family)